MFEGLSKRLGDVFDRPMNQLQSTEFAFTRFLGEYGKNTGEAPPDSDIAKLALQFSLQHPDIATTVSGSANPTNIRNWAKWAAEPIDQQLLAEVQAIFAPVKNLGHLEGLKENN